ncbi:MAG: cell division protein ZapA [Tannerella sp.]|jgi:cell division protein ZapA|nr:cell division protein ZapA [Tannerella sp.]
MSEEILITLEVIPGGKRYPLKINAEDEELVRDAAGQLRQKYVNYRQTFSNADLSERDLMAMIAIDMAVSHLRLEKKNDTAQYVSKIQQLSDELKVFLKEQ